MCVRRASDIDLAMFESQLQIIVDGLVGDLTEQGKIRDTNLPFLGALESGLLDLGFSTTTIGGTAGRLGATEVTMFLFPTGGTS